MDTNASDISICATALLELGARPINDFLEDNELARLCSNLYPFVRDEMLREHPWNFAKKRRLISPDTAKPLFGYAHQFTLPADYIRLIEVNDRPLVNGIAWPEGYQLENGKVLANTPELRLRYIYRNSDPSTWDSAFLRVMITGMKKALAYAVTRDQAATAGAMQEWALALKTAKTVNGVELPPQEIPGMTFLASRY